MGLGAPSVPLNSTPFDWLTMHRLVLSTIALAATTCIPVSGSLAATRTQSKTQAQAEIWAKEQAIYKARGKGDLGPYINNVAADYLAWPPFSATPTGVGDLDRAQPRMAVENKEQLAMTFVGFAMNGDSAVIYYKTHRTRLPNGTPADEHFEVTHSWVRQNRQWKVFGGMARATPASRAR